MLAGNEPSAIVHLIPAHVGYYIEPSIVSEDVSCLTQPGAGLFNNFGGNDAGLLGVEMVTHDAHWSGAVLYAIERISEQTQAVETGHGDVVGVTKVVQ